MTSSQTLICSWCPHHCHLSAGKIGRCRARKNDGKKIISLAENRTTPLVVDPIEKKPLYHFFPGSRVLSFGTFGCNLRCEFCQNAHLACAEKPEEVLPRVTQSQNIIDEARKHIPKTVENSNLGNPAAQRGGDMVEGEASSPTRLGCKSVAFTYNEPIVSGEQVIEHAAACRAAGLKTVVVTNGFIAPEKREEFFASIDAVNVDLKSFTNEFYEQRCGAGKNGRDVVLDTLRWIARETSIWIEVTNLVIPGENDSDEELTQLAEWCRRELGAEVPLHFSAFRPAHLMRDVSPTPTATLHRARNLAQQAGLVYVYTGNTAHPFGHETTCPQCQQIVIARESFAVIENHVDDESCCKFCGTTIAGRHFPKSEF